MGFGGSVISGIESGIESGIKTGVKGVDGSVPSLIKQTDNIAVNSVTSIRAQNDAASAALSKEIKDAFPDAFTMTKGSKVIVDMSQMSSAAQTRLRNLAKEYNATSFIDGGKLVYKGVTWQRVGLVAGGVFTLVVLIDPRTGATVMEGIGTAGAGLFTPFVPSIMSSAVAVSLLLSVGMAAMVMMQMR